MSPEQSKRTTEDTLRIVNDRFRRVVGEGQYAGSYEGSFRTHNPNITDESVLDANQVKGFLVEAGISENRIVVTKGEYHDLTQVPYSSVIVSAEDFKIFETYLNRYIPTRGSAR